MKKNILFSFLFINLFSYNGFSEIPLYSEPELHESIEPIYTKAPARKPEFPIAHNELEEINLLILQVSEILQGQENLDGMGVSILARKCTNGTHNFIMGDIHGTKKSLTYNLLNLSDQIDHDSDINYLKIKTTKWGRPNFLDITINNPTTNLIFLGDNGDRGKQSTEVWKILLSLKIKHPQQVFLLRGNHETRQISTDLGFKKEWCEKFGAGSHSMAVWDALQDLFEQLPQALFLSSQLKDGSHEVIQCCHGGIGRNKDPITKTVTSLALNFLDDIHKRPESMFSILLPTSWDYCLIDAQVICGFLWGDFEPKARQVVTACFMHNYDDLNTYAKKDGWIGPKPENINLVGMIRGHEHHLFGVTMNGMPMRNSESILLDSRLVPVFTVISSALQSYSNAYIDLYASEKFGWVFTPHLIPMG